MSGCQCECGCCRDWDKNMRTHNVPAKAQAVAETIEHCAELVGACTEINHRVSKRLVARIRALAKEET